MAITKLLRTFMYTSLYAQMHKLLFLLDSCLGVEWLYHMVSTYLTLKESSKPFSKVDAHLTFSPAVYESFSSTSSPALDLISSFFLFLFKLSITIEI